MEFELLPPISHFEYCGGIFNIKIECPDKRHLLVEYAIRNNITEFIKKYIRMIKLSTKYCMMILDKFNQLSDGTKKCLFESEIRSFWTTCELVFIRKNFKVEDIPILAKINDFRFEDISRFERSFGRDAMIDGFYEMTRI